jgi:hypothetical protein
VASLDVRPAHDTNPTSALTDSLDELVVDEDEVVSRTPCVGEDERDDGQSMRCTFHL